MKITFVCDLDTGKAKMTRKSEAKMREVIKKFPAIGYEMTAGVATSANSMFAEADARYEQWTQAVDAILRNAKSSR